MSKKISAALSIVSLVSQVLLASVVSRVSAMATPNLSNSSEPTR